MNADFPIETLAKADLPYLLRETPEPPEQLTYRGQLPDPDMKLLAVVGSRQYTNYGKDAVEFLIKGLSGHNIGIVSGLALGIDSLAHQAAIQAGLYTLAIPGGGLDDSVIYPARHKPLARRILEAGGGLTSEYEPTFRATAWSFPRRNRLVCGIAHATLVIEAAEKSGSLITARLTADYNRELLVVPGSIFSDGSRGTHQFLKLGAVPITEPVDILDALGLEASATDSAPESQSNISDKAARVLEILREPCEKDYLIRQLGLPVHEASTLLMEMELRGLIAANDSIYRKA